MRNRNPDSLLEFSVKFCGANREDFVIQACSSSSNRNILGHGPMASAVPRVYNGGLGEEPPAGSRS